MNLANKYYLIVKQSLQGFFEDKCYLHVSSLTFYTLLSVVPILAVFLGLAKGFGFEKNLEDELHQRLFEQSQAVDIVVEFAHSLLKQAENSYIAGFGVLFLFLFVISLFWTIEASFNAIWKVKRSRPFFRIITDYMAMLIIFPVLFVIASSLTVFFSSQIQMAMEQNEMFRTISPLVSLAYRGLTLLLIWILFASMYLIMPNTKVYLRDALLGAIVAGTLYYLFLIAVINFQIGVSQYNAIYGSFAILPLFLFWLQISWLLVLFGAEISYHSAHLSPTLTSTNKRIEITHQLFTLLLMHYVVRSFEERGRPWTLKALAEKFGTPESIITTSFGPMIELGMISELRSDKDEIAYQPGRDLSSLTIHSINQAANPALHQTVSIFVSKEVHEIAGKLSEFERECDSIKSNIKISS